MENIVVRFQPELRDQIRASIVHYRAGAVRICDRVAGTAMLVAGLTLFIVGGWPWWSIAAYCFIGLAASAGRKTGGQRFGSAAIIA